jgi:hypothetical protein
MSPRNIFFSAFLALVVLGFLCSTATAQQLKITIKCETPKDAPGEKEGKTDKKSQNTGKKTNQPPRLKLDEKIVNSGNNEGGGQQSLAPQGLIPIGCTAQAFVTAGPGGPPGQLVNFTITQSNPANILGLKWNAGDPFTSTLQAPIQLDGSGYGVSNPFYVKGLTLGETILSAASPGFDGSSLSILVAECTCPIIPVVSPPRN